MSASEEMTMLYKQHRDAEYKYAYFLLAASAAAIGFALTQTKGENLCASQVLLAIAVLCWSLSFFCGCKHVKKVTEMLYFNHHMLKIESGQHHECRQDVNAVVKKAMEIRKLIEEVHDTLVILGLYQFRFIIVGAVFYIAWHITEMYLRAT